MKSLEQLYKEMADHTLSKCKNTCRVRVGFCCSSEYCDMASELMKKAGEPIPEMPFNKTGACVVKPHFRPLCTLHQCKINGLGADIEDIKWTKKYFRLRDKIESAEMLRDMGVNDKKEIG